MDVRKKSSSKKRLIDYDKLYLSVMDAGLLSCDEDTIFDLMDDSVVDAYCARGKRKDGADND